MNNKLDITRQNDICSILGVGGTRKMAARYVGCHERSIRNLARRDPAFAERLRQSEINPELQYLKTIDEAAREPKQWRAARWMMEHLYPHRYARRTKSFSHDEVQTMLLALVRQIQRAFPKGSPERRLIRRRLRTLAKTLMEQPPRYRKPRPRREPAIAATPMESPSAE